tara:strand:- start:666 stop:785 length:120 start_codon:yes stop_codon:yes gene_type:complete
MENRKEKEIRRKINLRFAVFVFLVVNKDAQHCAVTVLFN